jgi:hypothetical protein
MYGVQNALKNPDWLMLPIHTEENRQAKQAGRPRCKHLQMRDIPGIFGFLEKVRHEAIQARMLGQQNLPLLKEAQDVAEDRTLLFYGKADTDIFVRALEVISTHLPNLSFFRGASFDPKHQYTGSDFAPADMEKALGFIRQGLAEGKNRQMPILAQVNMGKFTQAYHRDENTTILTEGDWLRGSMDLDIRSPIATIHRVPPGLDLRQLYQEVQSKAISSEQLEEVVNQLSRIE